MSEAEDLDSLKRRLSPHLMGIEGVTGVGLGDSQVNVYLEADTTTVRDKVHRVVAELAPGAPIQFVVTGQFSAL